VDADPRARLARGPVQRQREQGSPSLIQEPEGRHNIFRNDDATGSGSLIFSMAHITSHWVSITVNSSSATEERLYDPIVSASNIIPNASLCHDKRES
jgi:hypothetical protein